MSPRGVHGLIEKPTDCLLSFDPVHFSDLMQSMDICSIPILNYVWIV